MPLAEHQGQISNKYGFYVLLADKRTGKVKRVSLQDRGLAIRSAVARLSPVSITTCTPSLLRSATIWRAVGRMASAIAMIPAALPSTAA